MDLSSTFDSLIKEDLIDAIQAHTNKCDMEILKNVKADTFELLEPAVALFEITGVTFDVPIPQMSQSALDFYAILTKFGSDIGMLISFAVLHILILVIQHTGFRSWNLFSNVY